MRILHSRAFVVGHSKSQQQGSMIAVVMGIIFIGALFVMVQFRILSFYQARSALSVVYVQELMAEQWQKLHNENKQFLHDAYSKIHYTVKVYGKT